MELWEGLDLLPSTDDTTHLTAGVDLESGASPLAPSLGYGKSANFPGNPSNCNQNLVNSLTEEIDISQVVPPHNVTWGGSCIPLTEPVPLTGKSLCQR
ncbi:hypothetical protein SKAU_G00258180 [Synaphobranchus kaupii]|uniref:Uncharacterized protein n=1 Tax=Synaphobranchus kaupii TaxID=118154 RepID=A0A9Q1F476_SYNKA|nr:hypothetical protein SKAU_G00258180 [Synaphobranchus kaupii]